jgi:acylphosphatase
MSRARATALITGHVQGVGFRFELRDQASANGVAGWVRNRRDGSVEAIFEGDAEAVERVLRWCGHGPDGARVMHVRVERGSATGEFAEFEIAPNV